MRYIIDQQTHDEIAQRHAWFWSNHRAEPLGNCKKCKHFLSQYEAIEDVPMCDLNGNWQELPDDNGFCSWFEKKGKE